MNPFMLLALRIIFGTSFLIITAVQVLLIIKLIADGQDQGELSPIPLVILVILILAGLCCVQVVIVCLFKLLHLVAHNRIFNRETFRWVDTIAIAIAVAAVLVPPAAYIPAELDDAPGLILVSLVLSMLIFGVALLVYVQRTLLAQAVNRDVQARQLESELDGVI
ncbi:DUF2975 domain-containing protein [Corynebacterium sp. A21]|uniref:DUF2975 domain-containing protein n=1 Tax=Corynebacterium sp. A21 TaxID=3457318 RepID=UPI003FD08A93